MIVIVFKGERLAKYPTENLYLSSGQNAQAPKFEDKPNQYSFFYTEISQQLL